MNYDPKEFKKAQRQFAKISAAHATLVKKHKLDFSPKMQRSPYESLVRSIAFQQLHGKAAQTILKRFTDLYAPKKFPDHDDVLKTSDEKMRACGFSASKVKSIKDIALKSKEGIVPTSRAIKKMENEEIIERLVQIYGVGRWTVEMLLIFQLGRLNVWPVDDFGVRKGYQVWKKKKEMPTAKELKLQEKIFAPYPTLGALYMWRLADTAKSKK